jgi:DNA adenine methylase
MPGKLNNDYGMLTRLPVTRWSRSPRPFIKWAGGKSQLLDDLARYFPHRFSTYFEPFLGGGAVFFYLVEKRPSFHAVLSDLNKELIDTYRVIKGSVEELINLLKAHKTNYHRSPKEYYYKIRNIDPTDIVERAARLIFLNKTCYNGLYRVNKQGKFNVPFGRYKNPEVYNSENLRVISQVLNYTDAELLTLDFQKATENAKKDDFIYFDPPYQPVSATASFTSYTNSGFPFEEQGRLADWFRELDKRGCKVLLSNSDSKEIRAIYAGYRIKTVAANRAISCKGDKRKGYTELIISNYK